MSSYIYFFPFFLFFFLFLFSFTLIPLFPQSDLLFFPSFRGDRVFGLLHSFASPFVPPLHLTQSERTQESDAEPNIAGISITTSPACVQHGPAIHQVPSPALRSRVSPFPPRLASVILRPLPPPSLSPSPSCVAREAASRSGRGTASPLSLSLGVVAQREERQRYALVLTRRLSLALVCLSSTCSSADLLLADSPLARSRARRFGLWRCGG